MENFDRVTATIARLEQQNIEQDRRLKKLESSQDAICELTYVTKDLLEAVKELTEGLRGHEQRIATLEHAPGDRLVKIRDTVVIAVATAVGGGILTWICQAAV